MRSVRAFLHGFARESRGSMSVEAVIVFPMLLWATVATYTFFDAYKRQNASHRANYTISDLISRQTSEVDARFMDGMYAVFADMTNADDDSWLRVSIVHCVSNCDARENRNLDLDWSYGANGARPLNDLDFELFNEFVPLAARGDRLILVETSMNYKPPFENVLMSFPRRDLVSHVVTRPRYAPQIAWDAAYDDSSGGNHSDSSEDYNSYDEDPDLPVDPFNL